MNPTEIQILPLVIPIDRSFDVQWNPPGHPQLIASLLDIPAGDTSETERDGHYTFIKQNGSMGFARKRADGTVCKVFEEVDFLVISDDVLLMNGNPGIAAVPGGGYGTLIKGPSIPAGDDSGNWTTIAIEDSETTAEEWLAKNFQEDPTDVPTLAVGPIEKCDDGWWIWNLPTSSPIVTDSPTVSPTPSGSTKKHVLTTVLISLISMVLLVPRWL